MRSIFSIKLSNFAFSAIEAEFLTAIAKFLRNIEVTYNQARLLQHLVFITSFENYKCIKLQCLLLSNF